MGIKINNSIKIMNKPKNKVLPDFSQEMINIYEKKNKNPISSLKMNPNLEKMKKIDLDTFLEVKKLLSDNLRKTRFNKIPINANNGVLEQAIKMGLLSKRADGYYPTFNMMDISQYIKDIKLIPPFFNTGFYKMGETQEDAHETNIIKGEMKEKEGYVFPYRTTYNNEDEYIPGFFEKDSDFSYTEYTSLKEDKITEKIKDLIGKFQNSNRMTAYPVLYDTSNGNIICGFTYKQKKYYVAVPKRQYNYLLNKHKKIDVALDINDITKFTDNIANSTKQSNTVDICYINQGSISGFLTDKSKLIVPNGKYHKAIEYALKITYI